MTIRDPSQAIDPHHQLTPGWRHLGRNANNDNVYTGKDYIENDGKGSFKLEQTSYLNLDKDGYVRPDKRSASTVNKSGRLGFIGINRVYDHKNSFCSLKLLGRTLGRDKFNNKKLSN